MKYGPQDWDLTSGVGLGRTDPRVWKHKACGERLEFPDDKHRCPVTADHLAAAERLLAQHKWYEDSDGDDDGNVSYFESCEIDDDDDWPCDTVTVARALRSAEQRVAALEAALAQIKAAVGTSTEAHKIAREALGEKKEILLCTRCGKPITNGYMIGDGDGSGQCFAHVGCYRAGVDTANI